MADEYFAVKSKSIARYDIPASLAREIGRFLVTWAHFEHYVQAVVWNALQVSEEQGRIAVREPRVTDLLDMILDLGECQNLEMDYVLLKEIRGAADILAGKRHLLAHSLWQKLDNDWCAIVTRGTWQQMPMEIRDYPMGRSKNLEPQAIPISVAEVREWSELTIGLLDELKKVGDQHRPLPSPEKPSGQSKRRSRNPDQSGPEHKRQPQSSRQRRDAATEKHKK
jgi:hypothetical protein